MADSMKLAVASTVLGLLAWSGLLSEVRSSLADTLTFIVYLLWPGLSLVLALLTAVFAVRDSLKGYRWQGATAVALSLAVLALSWTHFQGWE